MILLDTNVLSALMRDAPDAMVTGWLDRQPAESIWITSLTLFEVRFGLALLPPERKRRALEAAFDRLLDEDLEQRIVDVDPSAAAAAATLAPARQAAGRPVDVRDTLIGGIALAQRATLATWNVRHFADFDVPVVNPWEPAG
jgi:toxin FitB